MKLLPKAFRYRVCNAMLVDLALITTAWMLAYLLWVTPEQSKVFLKQMWYYLPMVVVIKLAVFSRLGLHLAIWRYTSGFDLKQVVKAVSISTLMVMALGMMRLTNTPLPRRVMVIDWFVMLVLAGGARFGYRMLRGRRDNLACTAKPVLICGTGPMASAIARELTSSTRGQRLIGFIEDDFRKSQLRLHGVEVLGPLSQLEFWIEKNKIQRVIVADPEMGADRVYPRR